MQFFLRLTEQILQFFLWLQQHELLTKSKLKIIFNEGIQRHINGHMALGLISSADKKLIKFWCRTSWEQFTKQILCNGYPFWAVLLVSNESFYFERVKNNVRNMKQPTTAIIYSSNLPSAFSLHKNLFLMPSWLKNRSLSQGSWRTLSKNTLCKNFMRADNLVAHVCMHDLFDQNG